MPSDQFLLSNQLRCDGIRCAARYFTRHVTLWASLSACALAPLTGAADSVAPLADAIQHQDVTAIRTLLQLGGDLNAAQPDGMTGLLWAVRQDHAELVEQLVDAGADVQRSNRYGATPLSVACQNGSQAIVDLLLAAGAAPESQLRGGETVLMTAARTGRLGPVQALIARGADVNAKLPRGQTALMWAAAEGHTDVVEALIAAGADPRATLRSGFTPFFFAVREGHTDVVAKFLDLGIGVNDTMQPKRSRGNKAPQQGLTPLALAIENGHFGLAVALLEAGADPNDQRSGYGVLHAIPAVRKPLKGDVDPPPGGSGNLGSLEFVRRLVRYGADVNLRHPETSAAGGRLNRTQATGLLLAAETADLALMRLLIELGADPNAHNIDHCTPLLAAAGVGILSDGDETAATETESIEAIRLLLSLGADINAVDDRGETAMHGAAYKSRPRLVQFLADHGAKVEIWNRANQRGWTPLLIARGNRPGNFRPSPATIAAIEHVMQPASGAPQAD